MAYVCWALSTQNMQIEKGMESSKIIKNLGRENEECMVACVIYDRLWVLSETRCRA
ncbi:hypothetical protein THF1C08_270058 [Vibrio jasicida]|uniref:Uncharacterized protein n=1 Tax=Vibrio jasicida TaxID=766224 RepID=A0AAU9QQ86_9VIBR|nr:hypothetical protein THF1C08_270058 [Vibrio jasicida]CAH1593199.1 hypothetical protein THF1A12_260058 [Vibrio jasicida]